MPVEVETRVFGGRSFCLGGWLVEPTLNRISLGDNTVQLKPKVMDVLIFLAERADQLVTREQLFDQVWAVEYITDNTLTHAITELGRPLATT